MHSWTRNLKPTTLGIMPTPTSPGAAERRHTVQELQLAIRLRWYVDRGVLEDDPCARLELKREIEVRTLE